MNIRVLCCGCLVVMGFILPQKGFGQKETGTISGKVLFTDGAPAVAAHVMLKKTGFYAIADDQGNFKMEGVPYGKYVLTAGTVEGKTAEVKVNLKQRKLLKNLTLHYAVEQLEEVIVTGKTEETAIETKGFAVNAIPMRDLKMQSLQANEVLDQSAGVRIRQDGGMGSHVHYNINGLTGSSVRLFIDGVPLESFGSSFSLNSIPVNMIKRIEVYKGVVPPHLSSDALGGAINVVLDRNQGSHNLDFSYSVGSFNTHSANVNGSYRSNSGLTLSGSAFYNYSDNNYRVWGEEVFTTDRTGKIERITATRFHDGFVSKGGKMDVGFTGKKWADRLLVGIVLSDMQKDIQHGPTMATVYGNRKMTQKSAVASLSYAKENLLISGLSIDHYSTYSDLKRTVIDTLPYRYTWKGEREPDFFNLFKGKYNLHLSGAEAGVPTLGEDHEKHLTARTNLSYRLGKAHKFSVNHAFSGFSRKPDDPKRPRPERDMMDRRYSNKHILGFAYEFEDPEGKLNVTAFVKKYLQYVQLTEIERDFNGKLTAVKGHSNNDYNGYGLVAAYHITPAIQLMLSGERAIRMPGNYEIFGNASENLLPTLQLGPESSINLNLGLNVEVLHTQKHLLKVNSNLFRRDTKDMIRRVINTHNDTDAQFENQDKILSQGFDVETSYTYDGALTLTLGTSVFNARFNKQFDEHGDQYIYYRDRLRNEPFFTSNANARYIKKGIIQKNAITAFNYNMAFVEAFFRDWESIGSAGKDVIPAQLSHDIGLSHTFPNQKITLSLDAKNILNRQLFDNFGLQKPGRAFYLKINYKLF